MARFSDTYYDINLMAEDWAKDVYNQLLAAMKKKKIAFTKELQDSLKVVVNDKNDGWPTITISFGDYGRFIEMKHLYYSKYPPIHVLEEWVESRGLSKFKFVPGYQDSKKTPTRDQAISRIAWGIANTRRHGSMRNQYGVNQRRKLWKEKNLGNSIAHLRHLVAETLANKTKDSIIKALEQ